MLPTRDKMRAVLMPTPVTPLLLLLLLLLTL